MVKRLKKLVCFIAVMTLFITLSPVYTLHNFVSPKAFASANRVGGIKLLADNIDVNQTLHLLGYDYNSLDISAETDSGTFTTYNNVFEGLYREAVNADGDHVVVPALAMDTRISTDGLIYTFTLRDAKWSDGAPITAHDFEFSWKRLINRDSSYGYNFILNRVKNFSEYRAGTVTIDDVGIKALDDKTLMVTLAAPTPYFDKVLAFSLLVPQREDIVTAQGDQYGRDFRTMVFSGPFVIYDYQPGSKIIYAKNPNYWDAANVKLESIECPITADLAAQVQMFQSKQIESINATGDYLAQLDSQKAAGGYNHLVGYNGSTYYITFNMMTPVFASAKVRQAMSVAFDRQAFLGIMKRSIPAYGFVSPQISCGNSIYRNDVPEPVQNLISSVGDPRALFIQGLNDMNMDPDPSKVTIKMLLGPQSPTSSAMAQFIQDQFQTKLGINVDIVFSPDAPSFWDSLANGNFDIVSIGWIADYNDVSCFFDMFQSQSGDNRGKWQNSQYDNLIAQGAVESDQNNRLADYSQAEQILCADDPAIINTYYGDTHTFIYNYVKGLVIPIFGGYYSLKYAYITDICDINGDGVVDLLDLAATARNYNTNSSEAGWDPQYDFNKDGIVDLFDLVICSKKMN